MIYRKFTKWGKRIEFDEGERYCPECNGRGCKFGVIRSGSYTQVTKTPCGYCRGCGKTDWIQDATGSPSIAPPPVESIEYMKNNIGAFAALWLRDSIDKEILDSLTTSGLGANLIHYEMMKLVAKDAGVVVVTASQVKRSV